MLLPGREPSRNISKGTHRRSCHNQTSEENWKGPVAVKNIRSHPELQRGVKTSHHPEERACSRKQTQIKVAENEDGKEGCREGRILKRASGSSCDLSKQEVVDIPAPQELRGCWLPGKGTLCPWKSSVGGGYPDPEPPQQRPQCPGQCLWGTKCVCDVKTAPQCH